MDGERPEIAQEIRQVLRVLRRQAWIILLCVIVGGGVAYGLAARKKQVYQASAQLLIQAYSPDLALPNTPALFSDPTRARATAAQLITSSQVGRRVLAALHLSSVSASVSTSFSGDSDVISINVQDRSAQEAALLANAFAAQYVAFRRGTNAARFLAAATAIEAKLAREKVVLPPAHPKQGATRGLSPALLAHDQALGLLHDQARRLRLYAATQTGDAQIVQRAGVPGAQLPGHKVRDGLLGAGFGLLLGLALAFLREKLSDRITREDDLATIAPDLPVIGYIPSGRSRRWTAVIGEGFHNLSAGLGSIPSGGGGRSILVTSAMAEDGKSTTAVNLALALGERQESVLLVDADLRRPKVSDGSNLNAQTPGLSGILGGMQSFDDAVERATFEPTRGSADGPRIALNGELRLIPAGGPAARPQTLFNERSVERFVTGVRALAQNVIIDGPPLGLVADMLPVAKKVDGVLVVVRLDHTRPRPLKRLLKQLSNAGVKPIGLVVIGAETGEYYR
jgi:succinoglycan biosynthesis transport protein ExoP